MLELLKFIFESIPHFIGCLIVLSIGITAWVFLLSFFDRLFKHWNIHKYGYPSPHCDVDGYLKESDPKLKTYKCSDCQELNYLKDNGEITAGYCSHCSHPLWNSNKPDRPV